MRKNKVKSREELEWLRLHGYVPGKGVPTTADPALPPWKLPDLHGDPAQQFHRRFIGYTGIVYGLHDVLYPDPGDEDHTVTFAVIDHPRYGNVIHLTVTIGRCNIHGVMTWRWCGEGDKPDGAGSHALCATYEDQDLALAAAKVAGALSRYLDEGRMIYRVRG